MLHTCGSCGLIPAAVVNTSVSASSRALSMNVKPLWNRMRSISLLYPCTVTSESFSRLNGISSTALEL